MVYQRDAFAQQVSVHKPAETDNARVLRNNLSYFPADKLLRTFFGFNYYLLGHFRWTVLG